MPADLVQRVIDQSRSRGPFVHAMALLSGSRVLAAVDNEAARQAFAGGVEIAESLPLNFRQIRHILDDAVRYGALADPAAAIALFRRLPSDEPGMRRHSVGTMLVQSLVQGGEFEAALELLEDPTCDTGGAQMIVHLAHEPAHQRRAFLAARERWRNRRSNPFPCDEFLRLFSLHWRKLEPGEREIWLDEILEALDNDPDQPANAGFGERVQFHSMRDSQLFEILNVMHALKPPGEVAAILRAHPNVEDAAKIYPLGLESLISDRPPVPAGGGGGHGGRGYIGSGSRDRGLLAGMRAAHQGDPSAVPQLLAEARRLHREDLDPDDPNLAPHVFWPSCHAYKLAMYWAGRSLGMDAEPELARIPDTDFAILAAIELAAGALALPEPFGVRMEHHPHRHP